MATLVMMYPARGGLVWGQMKAVLSEVRGLHPQGGVCITLSTEFYYVTNCVQHVASYAADIST